MKKKLFLLDEQATLDLGKQLAQGVPNEFILFLYGDLGAGKTTLVRGFMQGLGHQGAVKSPTYTLVEPYHLNQKRIYHFDLYRLMDPEELDFIGVRDYFDQSICLVEWPEKGKGFLPKADVHCYITVKDAGRSVELESLTARGKMLLEKML